MEKEELIDLVQKILEESGVLVTVGNHRGLFEYLGLNPSEYMSTEYIATPHTGGDEITTVERRDYISQEICPSCSPHELYDSTYARVPTGNGALMDASPLFGVDDLLLLGGILKVGGKVVARQAAKSGAALAGRKFARAFSASF